MLLYLLKVLLHMEHSNCIGPTRIWVGVGIQNLFSLLKEQFPWKIFLMGCCSSLLKSKTLVSTWESSLILGNPMCKETVIFSSLTPTVLVSFNPLVSSVSLLRRGKHWMVSFTDSCRCGCGYKRGSFSMVMGFVSWICWVTEDDDEEEEDGLSHSMKLVGDRKQRLLASSWW